MKKFISMFIFIQLVLTIYIFNSSVMNIYEKNSILPSEFNKYEISTENLTGKEKFFNKFENQYGNYNLISVKNTINTTDKTIYEIYASSPESLKEKHTYSKNINYIYKPLNKYNWMDSTNTFYTNLPQEDVENLSSELDLNIREKYEDNISYLKIIKVFLYNFVVLILVSQIIYLIYISYNFKNIGLKLSMGFSKMKIFKEFIRTIILDFIISFLIIMIPYFIYLSFQNRITFQYVLFIFLYFLAILIINIILLLNSSILIKFVNLDLMIKNKTFNKSVNIFFQIVKIAFVFIIMFSINNVFLEYSEYKGANENILKYRDLNNYYTCYGTYIDEDDKRLSDKKTNDFYSKSIRELYKNENPSFISNSYFNNYFNNRTGEETNFIIANTQYLNNFSNIGEVDSNLDLNSLPADTVLVPESLKKSESKVLPFLKKVVQLNTNLNNFNIQIDKLNIVYVPDTNIKIHTDGEGFKNYKMPFTYIDTGTFHDDYYLSSLGARSMIFKYNSLDEFTKMLDKYGLNNLVIAISFLTPYLQRLENIEFQLSMLSIFSVLFTVTLLFIIYIGNFVNINVNKKRYVHKEILGYSHFKILKINYLIYFIVILISLGLSYFINLNFLFIIPITIFDALLMEIFYRIDIKNKLYEIVKGA